MAKKARAIKTYCTGAQVEAEQREELKKMGVTVPSVARFALDSRGRCAEKGDEATALKANEQLIKMIGANAPEKHEVKGDFTWADVVGKKA
ncbi:MAG: hypothetical protein KGJ13_12595 [Patescibacteria group bacterium]|nr:hypothetical protein [Patescibacteria group bacterium]